MNLSDHFDADVTVPRISFMAVESLISLVGIVGNIIWLVISLRQNVFQEWYKNRTMENESKMLLVLMAPINVVYLLLTLADLFARETGFYYSLKIFCNVKVVVLFFVSYAVVVHLYLLARTLQERNLNRLRVGVELGILCVVFIIFVSCSSISGIALYRANEYYCSANYRMRFAYAGILLILLIYIFIISLLAKRKFRQGFYQYAEVMNLGWNICFLYFGCWLLLSTYELIDGIVVMNFSSVNDFIIYNSLYNLTFVAPTIYPIMCFMKRTKIFDHQSNSVEVKKLASTNIEN